MRKKVSKDYISDVENFDNCRFTANEFVTI